jgi:glutamate-ammonia-ligase adenylyltransferase
MALVRSRMLGYEDDERWNALVGEVTYGFPWDDAAFESIRHLKRRIETEKNKESRTYLDFKYGKGGIADLEFLVQSLQLRYGARHAAVRAPGIVAAIPALRDAGALSAPEADELLAAHKFQRRVENRYQLLEEWSSREISRESPKLIRLARSLGYEADSPAAARRAFLADWEERSRSVRRLVEQYFYRS